MRKGTPWDELTVIREKITGTARSEMTPEQKRKECEEFLLDLLTMGYLYGVDDVCDELGVPSEQATNGERMVSVLWQTVGDEDFSERVHHWVDDDGAVDVDAMMRVAETELHRVYETGANDAAVWTDSHRRETGFTGNIMKTWRTMMDDRVRDEHWELEGVTVPFDSVFATANGDTAQYPGGFGVPELDINCRCTLDYTAG